jgi:tape measure domain-containing protein
MSSKIDERVVGMKFNGDQFQKGVADTSKALEKLKQGLNLGDAAKGLNDLDRAGKNFSLTSLADGVSEIASKFGAMSVVAITALANIANRAVDAGITIAKSLTIDPVKAGFAEYELKMGSIQTILSNTARYGTQLPEVTANLDALNTYADKTIYNFGDMTKNIGLFTNAGLQIGEATSLIKGFSNEAAASGTNAQGAAGAAYQLSQALSAGTIRLMDWRSLQNVGMGNKNMQNGLIEIAESMGMFNDETTSAEEASKNFNGSLEHNWLSADVMSNYLKIMAGDMDAATQASLGLSDAQIATFKAQQEMSENAATKVRTFTQLLGTMQESVGSGWSETFDLLIGDFNQATDLWTAVNDELGGVIGHMAETRNDLIRGFVKMGGRDNILSGIASIWQAVKMYIMPIQSAFKEIFPPITIHNLLVMANNFKLFAESMKPSAETMKNLKSTFMGVFAVLDIGWMIIKQVIGLFGRLFGAATEGAGGVLAVTAGIGDWLVKVRDAIKNGDALNKIFEFLGNVLQYPIDKLRELGAWTVNAVSTWDLAAAWEAVANAFKKIGEFLAPVWVELGNFFRDAKKVLGDFFETMDFNVLVGLLNVGALTGIGIILKKAFDFIKGIFDKKEGGGMVDTIKGVFTAMTDTFDEMQNTLKAASLMGIAIAIGLLTAAVVALSFVDTAKLFIVLGAMTIMFGQLAGMMVLMDRLVTGAGKLWILGGALIGLATAMVIFAAAVKIMASMDWVELARGLSAMAIGLALMVAAMKLLDGKGLGVKLMVSAGAMVVLATAIVIMAGALKIMATMSWDDILRASAMLAGSVAIMVGAGKLAQKGVGGTAALLGLGVTMAIMAGALKVFSTMGWDDIGRAITVMGATVGILVGAVAILSTLKMAPVGAATMIAMAIAITILTGAMKIFATFSWDEIGRSLVMLAGSLAILAGAMALMGIPIVALGGLALFVVSAGLMMLAPALALLGTMSWDAIGRGLTVLGASIAILAVGGLLLIPASVGFLLLGTAIMLIGTGAYLAGAGLLMMSAGLVALAAAGTLGTEALKAAVEVIIGLIPTAMAAFAQGIIDFALVIAGGATEFTAAMTTLITSLLNAINTTAPLVIDTIWNLVVMLVNKVVEGVPFFVDAGMRLLIGILDGIANNVGRLIDSATAVIVNFIDGIARNLPTIIQSGANLIISFVEGLAQGIRNNKARMQTAAKELASEIISGLTFGLSDGIGQVMDAARRVAENALNAAKNFLGIASPSKEFIKVGKFATEGFVKGLTGSNDEINAATKTMREALTSAIEGSDKTIEKATDRLKTLTKARKLDYEEIRKQRAIIAEATAEKKRASAALKTLNEDMDDERDHLRALSKDYDKVTTKLEEARKKLEDAKKTRDDYAKSLKDQFDNLPSIDGNTTQRSYYTDLKTQVKETLEFTEKLQELRSMGLNDALYEQLLSSGTAALPFMDDILAQGKGGVAELNSMSKQLTKASSTLGSTASKSLYQAAVDSAAGLVEGLKKQEKAISSQMDKIATAMVETIKKKLGIKSPSREFMKLGKFTSEGLALGIRKNANLVNKAGEFVGDGAIHAVRKSIEAISSAVMTDVNVEPTIRPVLDLSAIRKDSGQLDGILNPAALKVDKGYAYATNIASATEQVEQMKLEFAAESSGGDTYYTQNNYSPKALSQAEIYRNTRNQLSVAKGKVTTNNALPSGGTN